MLSETPPVAETRTAMVRVKLSGARRMDPTVCWKLSSRFFEAA